MKRILLTTILLFAIVSIAVSQNTLPNTGFEDWEDFGYYEEPAGGVWTTANRAVLLNPEIFKVTTFKTEDAYAGNYAAMLVTDLADLPGNNDILQSGALATGVFDEMAPPPANLKTGTPFTARPHTFKGYYKYFSVEHDSLDMWAILTKWNSSTSHQDTVGVAWVTDSTIVREYTLFDIPFIYYSEDEPDSIHVVFSPSAAGDLFLGQVGSTLYVDEILLQLVNGIGLTLMPEIQVKTYPNPASDVIHFLLSDRLEMGEVVIYDVNGKELLSRKIRENRAQINISNFIRGTYYYTFLEKGRLINSGTFLVSGNK